MISWNIVLINLMDNNMATTVQEIENKGLAYKFIRGSHLYGTNVETSDVDFGGVYIADNETLMGLPEYYEPQISDEKHDTTYYELGRWVELLMKANPNALESLFAPDEFIIGDIHPAVQLIRDNRDLFVTKECFNSLVSYAYSQISKARGLNKKIVNPVTERKGVLDFCYTFKEQGSESISEFLTRNNLSQKYCGLVNIPNMKDVYGVYYDFAAYLKFEDLDDVTKRNIVFKSGLVDVNDVDKIFNRMDNKEFFGYVGICSEDGDSNEVRLSSIPKGEKPLCFMTYNKDGYTSHCKRYWEYQEWVKKRNPIRYESNLKKSYDAKNIMHTVRLLHMGKELAEGKGFNVVRTWDRQLLLDIRNHKYEYDEIMNYVETTYNSFKNKIDTCSLPDTIDKRKVNKLLICARKM
jgi:predicted nucleotidyltransferase